MDRVTVFAVGGTGESFVGDDREHVTGMLSAVVAHLDSDRFDAAWIAYPASFGPVARGGLSYRRSTQLGVDALASAARSARGPVVLIGYSQGATVVRALLGRIATGAFPTDVVIAAGLISDPQQPRGVVDSCRGHGVAGTGPSLPPPVAVKWIAHPADMICNASVDSIVRDVADLTRNMSLLSVGTWLRAVWMLLRSNRLQNAAKTAVRPSQWRRDVTRLRTAREEILGYLPQHIVVGVLHVRNRRGGRHTCYGHEDYDGTGLTGCQVLADWLTATAERIRSAA